MNYSIHKYCFLIFILLFLLFSVVGKILQIPVYEIVSMLGLGYVSYIYMSLKIGNSVHKVFVATFIFQFLCALFLKTEFILFAESPHGPSADDGILYYEYAQKGAYMTADAFKNYVSDTQWDNVDDYGFLFYLRFICQLFPQSITPFILILLNAVYISIAAMALMKTMLMLDNTNPRSVALSTAVFSSFIFFVNLSAVGLKEDIFVPIICVVFYYMTSYFSRRRLSDLLFIIFWISLTFFFRVSITLILVVVFLVGIFSLRLNRKIVGYGIIAALFLSPVLLDFVLRNFLGVSLEVVQKVAENRYSQTDANSTTKQLGDMIAAVIGPFPNFSSTIDSIFYSYSSLLKMILNLPVLYSILMIFKKGMCNYYFIACFYLVGIMLTLVSGTGLDLRYHIPFFASFIILLRLYINKFSLGIYIWGAYLILCCFIVYFYNLLK